MSNRLFMAAMWVGILWYAGLLWTLPAFALYAAYKWGQEHPHVA